MNLDRIRSGFRRARRGASGLRQAAPWRRRSDAILFEREGLARPAASAESGELEPIAGAVDAVARARSAGVAVGVVTSGQRDAAAPERVNARVDELVGPVDVWLECTHAPDEGCPCRAPAPGLIYLAAAALGTRPERCVVVGAAASVEAARAAGARAVLVPSAGTSPEEIAAAPAVAPTLERAVELALGRAA